MVLCVKIYNMSEIPHTSGTFYNPELGATPASAEKILALGSLAEKLTEEWGEPYTVEDFLNDRQDITVDVTDVELPEVIGKKYEQDRRDDAGEFLSVVHYNDLATSWVDKGRGQAPGLTRAEIRFARTFANASLIGKIELLDTKEGYLMGECFMPEDYRPSALTVMGRYANAWGMGRIWESYINTGPIGARGIFDASLTGPMATHVSNTLRRLAQPDLS
jgi:hypothetical protein